MHGNIRISHFRYRGKPTLTVVSLPVYRPIGDPTVAPTEADFWGYIVGMSLRHKKDLPSKEAAVKICQGRITKTLEKIWKNPDSFNDKAPVPFVKNMGAGTYIIRERNTVIELINFLRQSESPDDLLSFNGLDTLYKTYREVFYEFDVSRHRYEYKHSSYL